MSFGRSTTIPISSTLAAKTLIGAELAVKYGIKDEGDRQPPSYRDLFGVHPNKQYTRILR